MHCRVEACVRPKVRTPKSVFSIMQPSCHTSLNYIRLQCDMRRICKNLNEPFKAQRTLKWSFHIDMRASSLSFHPICSPSNFHVSIGAPLNRLNQGSHMVQPCQTLLFRVLYERSSFKVSLLIKYVDNHVHMTHFIKRLVVEFCVSNCT